MDRLLEELTSAGALDAADAEWVRAYQTQLGGTLDSALLELDLIDEETLLRALGSRFGRPVATLDELGELDSSLASRLPASFSSTFSMCPLRMSGRELTTVLSSPLPPESVQELSELFGLEVRELVAPTHYVALARSKVYGSPLDARARQLESRLARRRRAPDLADVASRMASAGTISAGMQQLLELGDALVEHCCFLVQRDDGLHVVRAGASAPELVTAPEPACSLWPALSYGGYFVGNILGTDADLRFFAALGRAVPKKVILAPAPTARAGRLVFYADNGPRGIATRWIAELTVLVGRLGRGAADPKELRDVGFAPLRPGPRRLGGARTRSFVERPTAEERRVLERLRRAAAQVGLELEPFVESLLGSKPPAPEKEASTSALVGEMQGLFERLATDIPARLARGMEVAFRDIAPRLAAGAALQAATESRPRASASVELVAVNGGPREVGSYASRRQKTARLKL